MHLTTRNHIQYIEVQSGGRKRADEILRQNGGSASSSKFVTSPVGAMVREHLSAVNVKDGVENPGCNGWVLVTTGQELWRERVLHEKDAAFRARARLASTAVRMERSPFTQPWMPSTARYETAAQQQLALRQEIFSRNWRIRQESTVPNLAALTGTCQNGAITGRVRSKPALTQSWSTTVTT